MTYIKRSYALGNEYFSLLQEITRNRASGISFRTPSHVKKVPEWSDGNQKVDVWPFQFFLLHEKYFREWHIFKNISNFVLE